MVVLARHIASGDCCANSEPGSTPGWVTTRNTVVVFSYEKAFDSCQKWLETVALPGDYWWLSCYHPENLGGRVALAKALELSTHLFAGYRELERGEGTLFQTYQAPRRPVRTSPAECCAGVSTAACSRRHLKAFNVVHRSSCFSVPRCSLGLWHQRGCWSSQQPY